MKITEGHRAILIVVCIMVAFNGIFLSVNGLCMLVAPSVIPRDFPAVTLPAIIGVVLTLWAIHHSRAERTASA